MKALVIFMLFHNTPTGQDTVWQSAPMPVEQCLPMQRSVWSFDWPTVIDAETGEAIPVTDAACVPVTRIPG